MSNVVRLDIVDYDADYSDRLQATFYLVNPDEYKFKKLKRMVEGRFERKFRDKNGAIILDWWDFVIDYIEENFETVEIETKEIRW